MVDIELMKLPVKKISYYFPSESVIPLDKLMPIVCKMSDVRLISLPLPCSVCGCIQLLITVFSGNCVCYTRTLNVSRGGSFGINWGF